VGFVGLGQMGSRMATNLLRKGHRLVVYDALPEAAARLSASSDAIEQALSPADLMARLASSGAGGSPQGEGRFVISMLPNSEHVRSVYTGPEGLLQAPSQPELTFIDCSTIDPATSRAVGAAAKAQHAAFVDAPVSGGVGGAEAATLTFMLGADSAEVARRCTPILEMMGKAVVHCGPLGNGQAAKLCNNLVLAISMAGVAEGMLLGQRLGVDKQVLASIFNTSSARCWSSDTYNPCPGVMDNVPATRDFEGGFATALMVKDLKLALAAAAASKSPLPTGEHAHEIFSSVANHGMASKDFSSVYRWLEAGAPTTKG